ncbi:MAG: hypothetical protein QXS67_04865, partial [Candidatus Nezhaarchaeales archaeon]
FAFTWSGKEIYRARCLSDVLQALKTVGKEVAEESIVRGYLQRWIRHVLLWEELAESIDRAVEEDKATCLKATIKMLEDAKSSL